MAVKQTRNARITFSLMVPLTMGAFLLGKIADINVITTSPDWLDIVALVMVASGVWAYNWFEEKPQKASIENL